MTNQTISPCPKCGNMPELINGAFGTCFGCKKCGIAAPRRDRWELLVRDVLGSACRELGIETVEQLKTRLAPDPRVAVLESIREFLALPIAVPAYLSERGRDYYILDVTEYRKQILKRIAAQRGEGV